MNPLVLILGLVALALGASRMSSTSTPSARNPPTPTPPLRAAATLAQWMRSHKWMDVSSPVIAEAQRVMGGIRVDGMMGPETRERARALGVELPS